MAISLEGKAALVTGGSRGIGKAIAEAFIREDAVVAIAAETQKTLDEAAAELGRSGSQPLTVQADVSVEEDVIRMMKKVVSEFGRLDILVNSAGISILGPVLDFTVEDWDRQMAVNARGTFLCCREAVRQMLTQDGNSQIINIVSNQGVTSVANVASYGASKHGVMGFTRSLNLEVQPKGIRVSALCPMPVLTKMREECLPDRDWSLCLDPSEIAEAAVYMATRNFLGGIREVIVGLDMKLMPNYKKYKDK